MSSCLEGRLGRCGGVGGRCGGDHEREERWERVLIEDEMLEGVCWSEGTLQRTEDNVDCFRVVLTGRSGNELR